MSLTPVTVWHAAVHHVAQRGTNSFGIVAFLALASATAASSQRVDLPNAPVNAVHDDAVTVSWVTMPLHAGVRGLSALRDLETRLAAGGQSGLPVEIDDQAVNADLLANGRDAIELEVLLDQSASMAYGDRLDRGRATLACALAALRPDDRAVVFGLKTRLGSRKSNAGLLEERLGVGTDGKAGDSASAADLPDSVATLDWPTRGDTSLIDGLVELTSRPSPNLGNAPRRWTIVVTDGGDNASRQPIRALRSVLHALDQPVLIVDVARRERSVSSKPPSHADLVLEEIGRLTGGAVLDAPREASEDDPDCTGLKRPLRSQLLFGFRADPTTEVRSRRVRVLSSDGKPLRRLGLIHPRSYRGHAPYPAP